MLRVLIVVPDAKIRELRRLVLRNAGFEVEAPEPANVVCTIEQTRLDALVVSRAEDRTGVEVIAKFRSHHPHGRVIAIAAGGDTRHLADVTLEPYDPAGLVQALQGARANSAKSV